MADAAHDMLQLARMDTIVTHSGEAGIEQYKAKSDEIQLVLLDLVMPEMDGEQVFRELKRLNPNLKIVLTSGYSRNEATRRFIGQDLAGFIQKPYSSQQLLSELERHF